MFGSAFWLPSVDTSVTHCKLDENRTTRLWFTCNSLTGCSKSTGRKHWPTLTCCFTGAFIQVRADINCGTWSVAAKTKNSFIAHHHVGSNIPSVCVQSLKTLSWPRRGGTMWRYRYLYCVYRHIHQGFTFHVTTILVSVRVIRSLSLQLLLSTDRCVYSVKNHRHGPLCQVWIHEPYRFHREAGPGEMRPLLVRNSTPLSCHCDDDFMSCMSGIQHEMSDLANKTEHIIRGYWWIMVEMGWGQHTCFFPEKG